MAIGAGALIGGDSYLTVGRETTFGTYVTGTAALDFLSASIKLTREVSVIEQVERSRTMSKKFSLGRVLEGEIEFYYCPLALAANYILQNAFGGTVTSATATGETIGGAGMTHTFNIGSMDQSYVSLSLDVRKGGAAGGKAFQYNGFRVSELEFTAEIDAPLILTVGLVGKDATQTANTLSSALVIPSTTVLSFADGRFSVEGTFASLTSSSYWHVQTLAFTLNNNLNSEAEARRIGSDTVEVLPPGIANMELTCTMRFDTTTAWDAMVNATKLSAEFEFLGPTMTGSAVRQGIKLQFPTLYVKDAGDPEIGEAGAILTSEVVFAVLRDDTSATGYACKALVTNNTAAFT